MTDNRALALSGISNVSKMDIAKQLGLQTSERCLLAQAVLWLATKKQPLPYDSFAFLPSDSTLDFDYLDERKAVFVALQTGVLQGLGLFAGTLPPWMSGEFRIGLSGRYLPLSRNENFDSPLVLIPKNVWKWDRIEWGNSRIVTPVGEHVDFDSLITDIINGNAGSHSVFSILVTVSDMLSLFGTHLGAGEAKDGGKDDSNLYRTGLPGRPSAVHLAERELDRRFASGEMEQSLEGECAYLVKWVQKTHPSAPHMTKKTLRNRLRNTYRSYKAKTR